MTPQQQRALALDHHIVVHANAGAGKTRVLVQRYIDIVLSGKVDRIEQIVATTFTIKAAAEMRSRIRAKMLELSNTDLDLATAARLVEFADNISSARITTLHSFCASLLRKYAFASHVDVDAQELNERRSLQWRSEAMRATVRAWLQGDDPERRERLLTLLDELDVMVAEETFLDLMSANERRERLESLMHGNDIEVVDAWFVHIHRAAKQLALRLLGKALAELVRLRNECGARTDSHITSIEQAVNALLDADGPSIMSAVKDAAGYLSKLYIKAGTPHKRNKPFDRCEEMAPLNSGEWVSLQEFASGDVNADVTRQLALVRTTLDIVTESTALYKATKKERNAIDFDDMMELTRAMLRRLDISADVQRGIRFLMVDEFQDTSPVQYDIIRLLVPDLYSASTSSSVNLFIVGDAKQSIYGFRSADVRLFLQATREIINANHRNGIGRGIESENAIHEVAEESEDSGYVVLSDSYRMSSNLFPVLNGICEPVFAAGSADIVYRSLTGGRKGAAAQLTGTCTVLRTDVGAEYEDDEENTIALDKEMRHVVQGIARMLHNTDVLVGDDDDLEVTRMAGPGDVAILVRTSKGVMAAGAALRNAGIPYQTHSGRAFFSRPEVADIRNLLLWCTDTDDDLAFSALVRSPLVLLHDAEIVCIAATPTNGSLWQRLKTSHENTDLLRAYSLLQQWTLAVHVLAPTEFIRRVLAESNWYSTLANDPRRSQILLNVEKVIELILAEQDTSNASLRDIVMTLSPPAKDLEGDRKFSADPNAVQVMTLHAAKGLEFPIVVLANIASRAPAANVAWSDAIGITFTAPKKIITFDDPSGSTAPTDVLHKTNRLIGEGAAREEDRRLLYVGLTRAKDHLLISMPYAHKKASSEGVVEERQTAGLAALIQTAIADVPCTVVEFEDVPTQYVSSVVSGPVIDVSAPLAQSSWLEIITATDLLTSSAGAASSSIAAQGDGRDATDVGSAAFNGEPDVAASEGIHADHGPAYGTLMHDILQVVVRIGDVDATERARIIDNVLATRLAVSNAHALARTEIAAVMDSAFVQQHLSHLMKADVESTLLASLDSTVLQGMMDVRFETDSTTMEVWDWKTNVIRNIEEIAALAIAYRPQAQAYAWLCLQAYPHIHTVRTRLLFTKAVGLFSESWVVSDEWTREMSSEIEASIISSVHAVIARRRKRSALK